MFDACLFPFFHLKSLLFGWIRLRRTAGFPECLIDNGNLYNGMSGKSVIFTIEVKIVSSGDTNYPQQRLDIPE